MSALTHLSTSTETFRTGRLTVACALLGVCLLAGTATAYWTTGGAGTGQATTTTLGAPADVQVSPSSPSSTSLRVSWQAPTTGVAPSGYRVTRDTADGPLLCPAPTTTLSCDVTNLTPDTTYKVVVTSLLNGSWTASAIGVEGRTTVAAPMLSIVSPRNGDVGVPVVTTITGTTGDTTSPVTVDVFTGSGTTGTPAFTTTVSTSGTSWTATPNGTLEQDRQYTAVASQSNAGGTSTASVSFTTAVAGATQLALSAPSNWVAGTPQNVTVTARKADGSTDATFSGPLVWGGSAFEVTPSSTAGSASFVNGTATVSITMRKAGTGTLTVGSGGLTQGTADVRIAAAAATMFVLPDCASRVVAVGNAPGAHEGRVGLLDAFGNAAVAPAGGLLVTFSSSNAADYSLTQVPVTIPGGATVSTAKYKVQHNNNASNSTVISTTNSGFVQATCTVQKNL